MKKIEAVIQPFKIDEVKEAELKEGLDRPALAFLRLGERAAAFATRRSLASFAGARRGNAALAGGGGTAV